VGGVGCGTVGRVVKLWYNMLIHTMVIIEFETTLNTNAKSIAGTYASARAGFYLKRGFYVLPKIPIKYSFDNIVTLPAFIDYGAIDKLIPSNCYDPKTYTVDIEKYPSAIKEIKDQLVTLGVVKEPSKAHRNKIVKEATEYTKELQKSLKYLKYKDIKVSIGIKDYGSVSSFWGIYPKNRKSKVQDIKIDLRSDMDEQAIGEPIASALTIYYVQKMGSYKWRETEAVSDFITKYILGSTSVIPTLKTLNKPSKVLLKKSINYLHSIGINHTSVIEYDENFNALFIAGRNITNVFSSYEFLVLRELTQNSGKVVAFDDLAKALYGDGAEIKFSLWGINKCIERVRSKLEGFGIPRQTIKNVKGVGFMLC